LVCIWASCACCRYNYVTPTSYLELLSTFLKLLAEKRSELTTAKKRLESGLDKLTSTAAQVEDMQKELQELQPVLAATAKEVEEMMQVIAHDKEEAAVTKRTIEQQEREANEQAALAKSIAGQARPQALSQPTCHCKTLSATTALVASRHCHAQLAACSSTRTSPCLVCHNCR
jgi:predicted  nucleic acid-binding Zn-ribbon protein